MLTLSGFPDGLPDTVILDVDTSRLAEVAIFGPDVAAVVDEFCNLALFSLILALIIDVPTSNTPQDNRPLGDSSQLSHMFESTACLVNSLLYLLASQGAFEVLHDSLVHRVVVTIS